MLVACYEDHLDVVQFLYEHSAKGDIRRPDNEGYTPMWSACQNNHLRIVQFLCNHGAAEDTNKICDDEVTPLGEACENDFIDIVQWLVLQGIPSIGNIESWRNKLNNQNQLDLFKRALASRDVDHESFLTLVNIVQHSGVQACGVHLIHIRGILERVGEYVRGKNQARLLFHRIIEMGDP